MGAKPGTKPAPTHLKLMEGVRPSRVNKGEPRPRPVRPTCPEWLAKEARAEWKRVAPELERMGLLTVVDRAALAGYCQSWARWLQAEMVVSEKGMTYTTYLVEKKKDADGSEVFELVPNQVKVRPEVYIAQREKAAVRAWCAEFGLTPSSRGRLTAPRQEEEDDGILD